jgi:hypothetical protein
MVFQIGHRAIEYDCSDCGRHIYQFGGPLTTGKCGTCTTLPNWVNDPELAKLLDPEMPLGGWQAGENR